MSKVRHVLGISGGKDSAALAIYLRRKYPELGIEYYFCDTGKELKETYQIVENLEVYLGKKIIRLQAAEGFHGKPFDYYYNLYKGYLPSANARWCTRKLKLVPFEEFVGADPVISYVGIRGDEDREGYISKKPNIQSIFPFRKNIWSVDVTKRVLADENIDHLLDIYQKNSDSRLAFEAIRPVLSKGVSLSYTMIQKLNDLLSIDIAAYNQAVFEFLKTTQYPLAHLGDFPLLENEESLVREDIFNILEESGVGIPEYYKSVEFTVDGKKGSYARSRSGCYFCFFQRRIEWVWLYEQHPDLFKKAMVYEQGGFNWMDDEKLEDLIQPERIKQIKEEHMKRSGESTENKSGLLIDILDVAEEEGCAACFI